MFKKNLPVYKVERSLLKYFVTSKADIEANKSSFLTLPYQKRDHSEDLTSEKPLPTVLKKTDSQQRKKKFSASKIKEE